MQGWYCGSEVKALPSFGFNLSSITKCSAWRTASVKPANANNLINLLKVLFTIIINYVTLTVYMYVCTGLVSFRKQTHSSNPLYLIRKFLIEYSNDCLRCIQMQLARWNSHRVLHLRKNKHLCCDFLFCPQISPEVDNHAGHKPIAWR